MVGLWGGMGANGMDESLGEDSMCVTIECITGYESSEGDEDVVRCTRDLTYRVDGIDWSRKVMKCLLMAIKVILFLLHPDESISKTFFCII